MNLSEPFIRRPIATALLMVGLFLAGIVAFRQLPVAALPEVDYPTIVVATYLPGASAATMAESVTTPLERQFGQIPSLASMTSTSSSGSSQITLQFSLDRSIDAAEQDVQAAINASTSLLPRTLPVPPTYSKSNPADTPILVLSVSSETLPLPTVNDFADSILAQKISQVSGVGLVSINGSQKPAVRVQVDPQALAGAGLTLEDVRAAIAIANVNQPKGSLDGARLNYTLATNDQIYDAAAFKGIVIAYKDGAPIRLAEVASVMDGVENSELAGWADDKRAIILNVQRQPGANVIDVADHVKALLPQLRATLPQGLDVRILSDRTETVRASVEDVEFTLVLTIGLVVAVIYVFLRNVRATAIPAVAVPLSLVGTFGIMYLLGYSLNNLSLMALTISTGFVVDDAIVMVENVARHIEDGMRPFDAALKGAKEIGFTIVSLTVSLICVLIPLLFMTGIIGRLFREFAVTLGAAIAVSAVLSLTLTAMMCAYLLRPEPPEESRGRFFRWFERGFDGLLRAYERGLDWVLAHQRTTLVVAALTVALTGILAVIVPKGFFPQQDTGLIVAVTEAAPDVSFSRMRERQQAMVDVVRKDPDVDAVASFIGADGTNTTTNTGRLSISLKPRSARKASATEIMMRLQAALTTLAAPGAPSMGSSEPVAGVSVYMQPVQDLSVDSRAARTQFQYTLESADGPLLYESSARLVEALRSRPELADVTSDRQSGGLEVTLVIDRDTASRLGVSTQVIDDTLYDAFGQRPVSTIFTQLNLYRVILEVKPEYRRNQRALSTLFVKSQSGKPVALSAFVHAAEREVSLAENHQGQFPAVTLSFNVAPGHALGDAVAAIHEAENSLAFSPTIHGAFQGSAQAFADSLASEPWLILAALVTVYIVLGVLYESFIHPLTILSTLPSAGVGAFLALLVCREDFTVIALIGIVLLIGIVKKNAIMMIDFAIEAERNEGLTPDVAIRKACLLRFRPIMMTTMAALLGGLPLALGTGSGAELRRPLGITIVGGLLVSQVLTLYTTPVIYLAMERLARRFRKVPPAPGPVPAEAL